MASDSSPGNRGLSQMLLRSPLNRYSLEVYPKRVQGVFPFCILGLFTIKSSGEGCVWLKDASRKLLPVPSFGEGQRGKEWGAVPETRTGSLMCALLGGRWACNRGY